MNRAELLKTIIDEAERIVFFSGAGVSTESGIPDFRSGTGLYNEEQEFNVPPEPIFGIGHFLRYLRKFYEHCRTHMSYPGVKPDKAHITLTRLEKEGKLRAAITQNDDAMTEMPIGEVLKQC